MGKRLLAAGLAAALALAAWAFVYEPSSLRVRHHDLHLPDWPASWNGLSIALLSDLHVGAPYYGVDKLVEVVEAVNEARPDVVLLAGDYVIGGVVGGTLTQPEAIAPVLAELEAPLGAYAVLGNHDWWHDGPRVRRALESAGIRTIDNEVHRIERGAFSFWLLGLGDYWVDPPDAEALIARIPESGAPMIALTHNPDVFADLPPRITLTLAGHTHGGQVRFPLVGAPVVPSRYGQRFAAGHIVEEGRHLFVTTGLGTSIFPVRFRVPPEVAILRLFASHAATDG